MLFCFSRFFLVWCGRFLSVNHGVQFLVGGDGLLLPREQVLDELPLVVNAMLQFAVLSPEIVVRGGDPLNGPVEG